MVKSRKNAVKKNKTKNKRRRNLRRSYRLRGAGWFDDLKNSAYSAIGYSTPSPTVDYPSPSPDGYPSPSPVGYPSPYSNQSLNNYRQPAQTYNQGSSYSLFGGRRRR